MTPILAASNLSKRFPLHGNDRNGPQVFAVDDVTFSIAEGESVGLVGESGCGKSTVVRLLARLLDSTSGEIRFDGVDIGTIPTRRFSTTAQRPLIQMVFQDSTDALDPRATAFDAIADPVRQLRPMKRAALTARVLETARLCGLPPDLLSRFPHQLSGGQKARVGIARAIAVEPRVLILDEPTSSLDVSVQVVILKLLDDLKRRLKLSYLFVSHDLNVIRLLCERVLVMYCGKLVETGTTAAVFDDPIHPYTAALLSAIPSLDHGRGRPRLVLEGDPPSPIDPDPRVCRFFSRCPRRTAACAEAMPTLEQFDNNRTAACFFPLSGHVDSTGAGR